MKKAMVYISLFAIVFAISAGVVLFEKASASTLCDRSQCLCFPVCTSQTGPNCTNPLEPNYMVAAQCWPAIGLKCTCEPYVGEFAGCCDY